MSKPEGKLHQYGSSVDFWWKVIRAVVGFSVLAGTAWTQFLGPGVKPAFQNFVGITEIVDRLDIVEQLMPPPAVVEWNEGAIRQAGSCTSERCLYVLNGARTKYGESCGKPESVIPFLRTASGQNVQIGFMPFAPVELTREPTTFTVPLKIPSHIQPGSHQFRVKIIYEHCLGPEEPIPRWTPWFPLQINE